MTTTSASGETGQDSGTAGDSGATDTGGTTGDTGSAARCPVGHECFFLDGVFHTADKQNPVMLHNMDVQAELFATVEVEVDFVHGGWYPDDPAGLHAYRRSDAVIWLWDGRPSAGLGAYPSDTASSSGR